MPTEGQVQGANQGGIPVPKPMPAAPSSSSPIPAPANGHVVIRPLRTYKDDLAEAIKKGNLSKTSIALAEKNKHAQKQAPVAPKMPPKPVAPTPSHTEPKAPPAPKTIAPSTPPAPVVPKPIAPVAPKLPITPEPATPRVPEIPATPKVSSPTPPSAPEDAEGKRRFFENLLHVRREEHPSAQTPNIPAVEKKPEPIAPPKSLAELLPKKESFSVAKQPETPASKPAPEQKPPHTPVVPPQPKTPAPKPRESSAKEASPFLPFWATPDGQAPTVEHTPEPEPEPKKPEVYVPLTPRADGPTRGSAVEDESSGFNLRLIASALGGVVLVVALGFGAYALFKKGDSGVTPIAREFPSHLVTVASTATIDTTGHTGYELANAFYEEIAKVSSGNAVGIVFTKTENGQSAPLTATEWFAQAGLTPPGMFVRALAPAFAAGSYESHNGGNAFFVFEALNRDRALAGLLSWEKTLAGDMRPYLNTEPLPGSVFTDRAIRGVAVRVAGAGESALVYGMIDDRRIIITRGEGTFAGLIDSLPQTAATGE